MRSAKRGAQIPPRLIPALEVLGMSQDFLTARGAGKNPIC